MVHTFPQLCDTTIPQVQAAHYRKHVSNNVNKINNTVKEALSGGRMKNISSHVFHQIVVPDNKALGESNSDMLYASEATLICNDFHFAVGLPFGILLFLILLFLQLFHHLTLTITVHHRTGLVFAILRKGRSVYIITGNNKRLAETLHQKSRKK